MQQVQLITYGKLKERYLRDACAEYEKRLSRFCRFQCLELPPVPLPDRPSQREIEQALEAEGQRLLQHRKGFTIALCIEGKLLSSPQLAQQLQRTKAHGDPIQKVIGSPWAFVRCSCYGISEPAKQAADLRLSLSPMTFPHQLARVMLLEQIYRSYQILGHTPYHK